MMSDVAWFVGDFIRVCLSSLNGFVLCYICTEFLVWSVGRACALCELTVRPCCCHNNWNTNMDCVLMVCPWKGVCTLSELMVCPCWLEGGLCTQWAHSLPLFIGRGIGVSLGWHVCPCWCHNNWNEYCTFLSWHYIPVVIITGWVIVHTVISKYVPVGVIITGKGIVHSLRWQYVPVMPVNVILEGTCALLWADSMSPLMLWYWKGDCALRELTVYPWVYGHFA
jgi:hypothetical protein